MEREALNVSAIVFVYRHYKDKTIKAEYYNGAKLLDDSADWEHIATINPRMWIECHYAEVEALADHTEDNLEMVAQPEPSVAGYCKKIEELIAERDNLRAALAQPAQGPVAWMVVGDGKFGNYELGQVFEDCEDTTRYWVNRGYELVPLYTTPPQREWVGLTEDERDHLTGLHLYAMKGQVEAWIGGVDDFAKAIEAKLKERNHGT